MTLVHHTMESVPEIEQVVSSYVFLGDEAFGWPEHVCRKNADKKEPYTITGILEEGGIT